MKSLFVIPILGILFLSSATLAQEKESYVNVDDDQLAIGGYDPVSYFMADKPSKGDESFSHEYHGAIYHFSSQENLDTFKADPAKYAPAYGGYCAYAMGKGYLANANPETFKILDGKLLLFYNNLIVNTLPRWNRNEDTLYPAAEQNWKDKVAFQE
ncbi:MAG: YHS domain-containing protein, partial [Balneolales bacterium]|nr:YHS domain-containing protein [Balneolales bacterium]